MSVGGSLREHAGAGHCDDRSGVSQRCGAQTSTQTFIYSIQLHGLPRRIMSDVSLSEAESVYELLLLFFLPAQAGAGRSGRGRAL